MDEFGKVCERKVSELKGVQTRGWWIDEKLIIAIEDRLVANGKSEKDFEFTLRHMIHHFNARLLKPQRLVSLTSEEEEERRCLRSWHRFDWKLKLACFRPLGELAELVKDLEAFREHVRDLVVFMHEQIPMWLKLKAGKHIYMLSLRPAWGSMRGT